MAKQIGEYFITGTIDDMCFYKMEGQYYVRMKSSLTRNRVRKSKVFANTMKSANELGAASVLASKIYRTLSKDKRKVELFRKMTGMAKLLLRDGESKERICEVLEKYIAEVFTERKIVVMPLKKKPHLFGYIKANKICLERGWHAIKRKNKRRRREFYDHSLPPSPD